MEYDEIQQEIRDDCPISDTELCQWAGKSGCMPCYVRTLKDDDDKKKALENWRVMISNLPADIDSLHESETCVLCKGEPNARTCYASVDMAHPEPKTMKGMFFGFGKKVRTPVGSLVTVHMACCDSCKRKTTLMDAWLWICLMAAIVLAFVLASIPSIANALFNINELLPVAFVVLIAVLGYLIGRSITVMYRKKVNETVKADPAEIPLIRMMLERGWFYFQDTKGQPRFFFKKKKTFANLVCKCPNDSQDGNVEKEP